MMRLLLVHYLLVLLSACIGCILLLWLQRIKARCDRHLLERPWRLWLMLLLVLLVR